MPPNEEKKKFIEYNNRSFSATIGFFVADKALKRQCPNFSNFYENGEEKYPRCLLNEYVLSLNSEKILTPKEATEVCPLFDLDLIETKCTYLQHYIGETSAENSKKKYLKPTSVMVKGLKAILMLFVEQE